MNYEQAVEFIKRETLFPELVGHSINVAKVAYAIAKALGLENVEEIRVAAVLHDVGKIMADKGQGDLNDHAFLSGKFLRKKKMDKYAAWVEKHGISAEMHGPEFLPKTIEEKIINYADSRVEIGRIVLLEERVKAVRVRYPKIEERCFDRYREFEAWLSEKLGKEFVDSLNNL